MGFWAAFSQGITVGDKIIYIDQITGIQFKLGGLTNGYIQFTIPGGNVIGKGYASMIENENALAFNFPSNDSATKLKEKIEELVQKSKMSTNQTVHVSSADEIKKFKSLLDEGIITKDEFDKKKKELLNL